MLATRVTAICIALGLHLLATADPTGPQEDRQGYGQHMPEKHGDHTVQRGRDGSADSDDMEGRKSDAEKGRGGKGMKDEKSDGRSGSSSMHAGIGRKGDKEDRESGTGTPHHAHEHEDKHKHKQEHEHDHAREHRDEPTGQNKVHEFGQQTRRGELGQRHRGQSSNGVNVSARNSDLGEVAGRGEKEEFAEEGENGPSSSSLFIGASVAGGVLAALTMAACWRWRTSSCCNSSNRKDAQLDAATTIVVGCTSPNASDKNNAKISAPFQAGQTVVVGVPIQSNADLELGMGKPTQK